MSIGASENQNIRKKSALWEWVESIVIAFILAMINPAISFLGLLSIYLLILFLAITISQIVLKRMY